MNPYQDIELDEARMSAAQKLSNAWDKQRAKSDASLRRTPSSIPKKEEPKKDVAEAKDPDEYDQEGDMAKGQLRTIIANAQRAHDMLTDDTNMAEWVQSKITLASDYISTVADYMQSQLKEETLSELNKDTLHSYRRKADKDLDKQGNELDTNVRSGKAKEANKNSFKVSRRMIGIDRAETRLNKEEVAICPSCQVDPCICDDSHGFVGEGKKPGYLTPGWMLKKDPELGAKVKAKIKIGKARAKSHGDINAGKSVKEEKDYSKPINSLKDKLMAMKKELSIVQKSHTKMEKEKEKADAAPSQEDHESALNHFKTQYLNAKRNKDDKGANDAARGYHDYSHKLSNIYQRKLKGLAMGEAVEDKWVKTGKEATHMKTKEKTYEYAKVDKEGKQTGARLYKNAQGKVMGEEVNPYINETLSPSAGAGEYVSDFEKSDAPQFKGKSKEKRAKMAVAAFLSAKKGKGSELPAGNLGNGGSVG